MVVFFQAGPVGLDSMACGGLLRSSDFVSFVFIRGKGLVCLDSWTLGFASAFWFWMMLERDWGSMRICAPPEKVAFLVIDDSFGHYPMLPFGSCMTRRKNCNHNATPQLRENH